MHVTLALFTWTAFWSILPVKIVAIAGFAYVILQTLKMIFPAITGIYSILLNVAFSIVGVVMVAKPGDFESPVFWSSLMLAIASAAGIHGTVKAIAKETEPIPNPNLSSQTQQGIAGAVGNAMTPGGTEGAGADGYQNAMQQKAQQRRSTDAKPVDPKAGLLVFLLLFGGLGLTGCLRTVAATPPGTAATLPIGAVDKIDAQAFLVLKPAHDFAASISADIISGKLPVSPGQQKAMENFNKSLNVADRAEKNYHAAGGGSSAVLASAITAVLGAWTTAQVSLATP